MKQINLYQAAFHPPRIVMPARTLLTGGVAFLCALLALYAWDAWRLAQLRRDVASLVERAAHLDTQVHSGAVARQTDPRLLAEAEALETRLRNLQSARDALASGALGSQVGYSAQFLALSRARVEGAWLTHIEVGDAGRALNLRGRALTGEHSARLIASLRREPLFVGLSFSGLTLAPPEEKKQSEDATPADATPKLPPRFLEFTLSAQRTSTGDAHQSAGTIAAGKLDVNQVMQAATAAGIKP